MNPAKAAPSAPVKKAAREDPTSGFGARHGLPKVFEHKKRRIVQKRCGKTKISPVDIPTGWNPRASQSPTGALAAICGWPPFSNPL